ncbi:hypothetical protein [Novosphingobium soli]|uniref:DUF1467 family protein n=1 Tax=Novosphingobium soli TaxID=574956 RepID=A0ABV6CVJ9_9SPHN
MPLALFPVLLAVAVLTSLVALIYLIVHARSVAELFRRSEIVPGPGRPRISRGAVIAALAAFNLGWIASLGLYFSVWADAEDGGIHAAPPTQP